MNFVYRFPVVRGVQSKREYYIAMIPLKMLSRLFITDEEYVPPEYRAQRRLNVSRIPTMRDYILQNRDSYVFSALAASIDGDFLFCPNKETPDTGVLEISMDSRFLINDGQHRKAAILEALKEDESLRDETISIVFFKDNGLKRSQQIFTDLNKHAVKTSNSISQLYDSRDELAVITRNVISKIEFLNKYTDKEKDNLGKFSSNLFTLNTFYQANKKILYKDSISSKTEPFLFEYWSMISDHIIQWRELLDGEITKKDLRENYIITQAVVMRSFGKLGKAFYTSPETHPFDILNDLEKIDWHRSSRQWINRAINNKGRMITNDNAVTLINNAIKNNLCLPLTEFEQAKETEFFNNFR